MKCGRIGCIGKGKYQPLIRIRAGVVPASGNDVLAVIRLPFAVCLSCRLRTSVADVISVVSRDKMEQILRDAKEKTGSSPNPDRTDVHWIRILGGGNDA
jgi:hypothetical protein